MYVLALATVVRLNSSLNRLDLKARSWSYFLLVSPIIEDTAAHLHMYILCTSSCVLTGHVPTTPVERDWRRRKEKDGSFGVHSGAMLILASS